jgi:hypothetical protein
VSPALKINIAQTVITAELLNPATASLGVTDFVNAKATNTIKATTSIRTFSVMNRTRDIKRIERTMAISVVITKVAGRYEIRVYELKRR